MSDLQRVTDEIAASVTAVKLDLARIYTGWSVRGPSLEASTAVTAMAQEEAGHARVLKRLARDASGHTLAVLESDPATWPELIGTAGSADIAVASVVRALSRSSSEELRGRCVKMAMEESFHEDFFRGWIAALEREPDTVKTVFSGSRQRAEGEVLEWLARLDSLAARGGILPEGRLLPDRGLEHAGREQ